MMYIRGLYWICVALPFIHVLKECSILFLVRTSSFNPYCALGIALKGGFFHRDIKNWCYRIPILTELGNACCIRQRSIYLRHTVLRMGYKLACGIAQSIIWNVLLYRDRASTDLKGAESMLGMTEAPELAPLREGGFIAVMYDSFLIFAPETTVKRGENTRYTISGSSSSYSFIVVI